MLSSQRCSYQLLQNWYAAKDDRTTLASGLPSGVAIFRLFALQLSLPDWPGSLPSRLTQLALSPLGFWNSAFRYDNCTAFLHAHLPQLRNLRHLAFHSLREIGDAFLPNVCTAIATALPQLISLHLVRMPVYVPAVLDECDLFIACKCQKTDSATV